MLNKVILVRSDREESLPALTVLHMAVVYIVRKLRVTKP